MNKRLVLCAIILGLGLTTLSAQAAKVIDISQTTPQGFPADGSALLVGDHDKTPTFFWTDQNGLSVYSLDDQGQFTLLTLPGASAISGKLSPAQMAPRSYWANAVFFWSQKDTTLTLWAIRDTGEGFVASSLLSTTIASGAPLPNFWVRPYGRLGWNVFYMFQGALQGLFYGFDGSSRSLGEVYRTTDHLVDLQWWERSDLDSGEGSLVVQSDTLHGSRWDLILIGDVEVLGKVSFLTSDKTARDWRLAYEPMSQSLSLWVVSDSQLTWVSEQAGQIGNVYHRDWGVPISLATVKYFNTPDAVVVKEVDTTNFWWHATDWSADLFLQGKIPWPNGPIPLLKNAGSGWLALKSTISDTTQQIWSFVRVSSSGIENANLPPQTIPLSDVYWTLNAKGDLLWVFHQPPAGVPDSQYLLSGEGWTPLADVALALVPMPTAKGDSFWTEGAEFQREGDGTRQSAWGVGGVSVIRRLVAP